MDKKFFKKCCSFSLSLLLTLAIGITIFFIFYKFELVKTAFSKILYIFRPILYGIIIAYLFRPICNMLFNGYLNIFKKIELKRKREIKNKKNFSLIFAIITSFLLVVLILILLIQMIFPQLITSIPLLINTIFDKLNEIINYIDTHPDNQICFFINNFLKEKNIKLDANLWIESYIFPYTSTILSTLSTSVLNVLLFIKDILIGIIIAIYLLVYKKKLGQQAKLILYAIFPKKWADNIYDEILFGDKVFNGFLVGKIIDSFIIGVLAYISLTILKIPFTPLISVIIGVTNIIPFFGPFIGAVPSAIIIFVENPIKALIFIIFIIILQQLDGNVIGPRILGASTGVSSFWVLFSILVFGGLFGVVGMIIGIPLFAILYDISKKIIYYLLNKKNEQNIIDEYHKNIHED